MELSKKVSFAIRMKDGAEKTMVNDVTLVFAKEEDVLAYAVKDAIITIQAGLRADARKEGNGPLTFAKACAELNGSTVNIPSPGTRTTKEKPDVVSVTRSVATSMKDRFPGITSDDLMEYLLTPDAEKPAKEAKFAQKYLAK